MRPIEESDVMEATVTGEPGRWELLLTVNGVPWKRYGPWEDRDTANMYAAEALRRAEKVATKLWEEKNGPGKEET